MLDLCIICISYCRPDRVRRLEAGRTVSVGWIGEFLGSGQVGKAATRSLNSFVQPSGHAGMVVRIRNDDHG